MEDLSNQQKAIAWLWVIDGLASIKHFRISLLTDLLDQIASSLPDDHMSERVRERVSLRCLEELFGSINSNGMNIHLPSIHNSKVTIDFSQSCETVLKRITDETPDSDLRNDGPGLLKWDVHSFIAHKKAAMPKCALKQLKESILDGSHPHADVLRGKSGLTLSSEADRVSASGCTQSLENSCSSAQSIELEGNSENGKTLLSERDGIGSDNGKHARDNDSVDWHIEAKKMKWVATFISQYIDVERNQVPVHGRECLQDTSHGPVSEIEGCGGAENQMAIEQNRLEDDVAREQNRLEDDASKGYGQSSNDAIHKNQTENPNPTSVPKDAFQDEGHQYSCVGEAKDDDVFQCEPRVSNVAPLGETQHKISAEGVNCNSEHDVHISTLLHSSTDQPQQLSNADQGNFWDPENMTGENLKRVNCSDDFHIRTKMKEWDPYHVLQSIEQNLLPLYSNDSSERDVPASERVRCNLAENEMEMMEENRVLKDDYDEYTQSTRNGQSSCDATHQSQLENSYNAASIPQDIIQDEACQHTCVDKAKDDGGLQLELTASVVAAPEEPQHSVPAEVFSDNSANDVHIEVLNPAITDEPQQKSPATEHNDDSDHCLKPSSSGVDFLNETQQKNFAQQSDGLKEHSSHIKVAYPASIDGCQQNSIADKFKELMDFHCESETSNESHEFHDKKIDAAMKKHAFLRSQCLSNDSSITTTEKSCSLDCDGGGKLLTCKSSNCPVVLHENWLSSLAISFEKGNFCCPFCSYSLALTDYLEAKKQSSLLETGLNAFIHANLENRQPIKTFGRVHNKVDNCSRHFEGNLQIRHQDEPEVNQDNQCEEHVNEVADVRFHNITYDKQQGPPSSSCTDVKSMSGKVHVPAGEKEREETVVHECVSAGVNGSQNLSCNQEQAGAVTERVRHITECSLRSLRKRVKLSSPQPSGNDSVKEKKVSMRKKRC